ncbi:MAG: hypothetical protein GY724_11820 [Actinomycetia bacterium]|nr:hypothetical protein [Actinomycetes bacterium]
MVANESLTIGRAVALLAAGHTRREEVAEVGVAGWGLACLVIERVRGWLADTNDNAIALLDQLEADPGQEDAIQALAQGIDLLLNPTSRIGRDLHSLIGQASLDEVLAPLLSPPAKIVAERSFPFFEPGIKLFPDDRPPAKPDTNDPASEDPASEDPAKKSASTRRVGPSKRKRERRNTSSTPHDAKSNSADSNGKGPYSSKSNRNGSAVRTGPSHRLFPLVETPKPADVEGDLFAVKPDSES